MQATLRRKSKWEGNHRHRVKKVTDYEKSPSREDRWRPTFQIESIIKDTIKKQHLEKLKKEKEEEQKKKSIQNMKKKLTEMNEEIRKTNFIKNEKLK